MAARLQALGELDLPRLRRFCDLETALYSAFLGALSGSLVERLAA